VKRLYPFFVIGTRPEFIKMAPILHICEKRKIDYFLLHTGQHYSTYMSDSFFTDMNIRTPDKNLQIGSGSHAEQTAYALLGIEKELKVESPNVVLVEGDTNAVLSAALAAIKLQISVGHVEAGLRSYDLRMPEEHNRRLTDHVSDFLFAPTQKAAQTLKNENVWGKISVTGNTVIDALEGMLPAVRERPNPVEVSEFALLTLHRAENVDNRETLRGLVDGLLSLETNIVFPAHPRTIKRLKEYELYDSIKKGKNIHIIDPIGYLDFLVLMVRCSFIMTDSGGIQEEATAPSINKRAFVLRKSTERQEAIDSGHVTVVGVDPQIFPEKIKSAIQKPDSKERICPYGDGTAAKKIVDILEKELNA
jgi:UDP-N-acetylglucosamine 2-epimerase (non-hydrolysing)